MKKGEIRIRTLIWISAALIAVSAVFSCAARMVPGFAQEYSVTVFPLLQNTLGRLAGLAPFSVSEMLCAVLAVLIIADIAACRHRLRRVPAHFALLASALLLIYTLNCGINYYRDPFVPYTDYEDARYTIDELEGFCEYAAAQLAAEDPGHYPQGRELADEAVESMKRLGDDHPGLEGFYPHPKQLTFMSRLFSMMGVSGIYSPFTIEANINGEMPDMQKPFTACHELSHLRGYMNEGQANYIGWLACSGSDNASFRRSGWLIAWIHAGNALARVDTGRYEKLRDSLPQDVISELEANTEFWQTHENRASEVQDRVNDAYLKSNGQEHGIMSYDQVTALMLMWYTGPDGPSGSGGSDQ